MVIERFHIFVGVFFACVHHKLSYIVAVEPPLRILLFLDVVLLDILTVFKKPENNSNEKMNYIKRTVLTFICFYWSVKRTWCHTHALKSTERERERETFMEFMVETIFK